ncbi:hypothetical protein Tco_0857460 [Tanacetum coccineum]|uniref:F-box domain, leucine-rich repeat domain, L domain-like protein n=1 Tax=Tanacetum coccineum TaxID=301880 RepID=A0ABQ5B7D8_9ASTR
MRLTGSNTSGRSVKECVVVLTPLGKKVPKEGRPAIISEIGDQSVDLSAATWIPPAGQRSSYRLHMHLQKAYNYQQGSFMAKFGKGRPTTGSYDWRRSGGHVRGGDYRQASDTQEYPSLIDTFWRTHTVDEVFPKDEDRRIYEEMKRLEATGEYTEDEINALARGGKLRGHIPGMGRVLPSRATSATSRSSMPAPNKSLKSMHRNVDFMMSLFRSDSKYSDMFKEFESGDASGSGGCGDDEESGDDEDGDGDD